MYASNPMSIVGDKLLWKNAQKNEMPHTLQELKDIITREIHAISEQELLRVNQNLFRRYIECVSIECVSIEGHQISTSVVMQVSLMCSLLL